MLFASREPMPNASGARPKARGMASVAGERERRYRRSRLDEAWVFRAVGVVGLCCVGRPSAGLRIATPCVGSHEGCPRQRLAMGGPPRPRTSRRCSFTGASMEMSPGLAGAGFELAVGELCLELKQPWLQTARNANQFVAATHHHTNAGGRRHRNWSASKTGGAPRPPRSRRQWLTQPPLGLRGAGDRTETIICGHTGRALPKSPNAGPSGRRPWCTHVWQKRQHVLCNSNPSSTLFVRFGNLDQTHNVRVEVALTASQQRTDNANDRPNNFLRKDKEVLQTMVRCSGPSSSSKSRRSCGPSTVLVAATTAAPEADDEEKVAGAGVAPALGVEAEAHLVELLALAFSSHFRSRSCGGHSHVLRFRMHETGQIHLR